jgi:hypothetical protein
MGYAKRRAACFAGGRICGCDMEIDKWVCKFVGGRICNCHVAIEKLDTQNVERPVLLAVG